MRRGALATRVVFVAAALALVGCAPPDRAQDADVDASTPPDGPRCGDGVVDPHFEFCDEGPLNGTPQGHCSRQCAPGTFIWGSPWWAHRLSLSAAPILSEQILFPNAEGSGLAFVAEPRDAIHLIREISAVIYQGQPYEERVIPAMGKVTSLASAVVAEYGSCPFWIEQAADGAQHLFFAEWPADAEPIVHEVAYPFPEGTHASLSSSTGFHMLTVVDVSHTQELFVGTLRFDAFPDIALQQRRFAAPIGDPDYVATTTFADPRVEEMDDFSQIIVQFFTNPTSFVSVHIDGTVASHTIEELGRGAWPYRVVAAQQWIGNWIGECGPIPIERLWPFPFITLSDGGDLVIWQFDRPWGNGEIDPIFAHVEPLPRAIQTVSRGILAYMPNGDGIYYTISDCTNLQAPALAPQRFELDVGDILNITITTSAHLGYDVRSITINSLLML